MTWSWMPRLQGSLKLFEGVILVVEQLFPNPSPRSLCRWLTKPKPKPKPNLQIRRIWFRHLQSFERQELSQTVHSLRDPWISIPITWQAHILFVFRWAEKHGWKPRSKVVPPGLQIRSRPRHARISSQHLNFFTPRSFSQCEWRKVNLSVLFWLGLEVEHLNLHNRRNWKYITSEMRYSPLRLRRKPTATTISNKRTTEFLLNS